MLLHSTDGGRHWTVYRSEALVPARVHFVTPEDGWLIATVAGVPWSQGRLFVTHDGGQSWQQVWPAVVARSG